MLDINKQMNFNPIIVRLKPRTTASRFESQSDNIESNFNKTQKNQINNGNRKGNI